MVFLLCEMAGVLPEDAEKRVLAVSEMFGVDRRELDNAHHPRPGATMPMDKASWSISTHSASSQGAGRHCIRRNRPADSRIFLQPQGLFIEESVVEERGTNIFALDPLGIPQRIKALHLEQNV